MQFNSFAIWVGLSLYLSSVWFCFVFCLFRFDFHGSFSYLIPSECRIRICNKNNIYLLNANQFIEMHEQSHQLNDRRPLCETNEKVNWTTLVAQAQSIYYFHLLRFICLLVLSLSLSLCLSNTIRYNVKCITKRCDAKSHQVTMACIIHDTHNHSGVLTFILNRLNSCTQNQQKSFLM